MGTVSAKPADGRSISVKFPEVNTITDGITALTNELRRAKRVPSSEVSGSVGPPRRATLTVTGGDRG